MVTRVLTPCAVACALLLAGRSEAKKVVVVPGWPKVPWLSAGVIASDLVFVSGMAGLDFGTMKLCPGGAAHETECALRNVRSVIEAAGTTMQHVVECTVYLASISDFADVNGAYHAAFASEPPARAAIEVGALAGGARVEIKCTAELK